MSPLIARQVTYWPPRAQSRVIRRSPGDDRLSATSTFPDSQLVSVEPRGKCNNDVWACCAFFWSIGFLGQVSIMIDHHKTRINDDLKSCKWWCNDHKVLFCFFAGGLAKKLELYVGGRFDRVKRLRQNMTNRIMAVLKLDPCTVSKTRQRTSLSSFLASHNRNIASDV